MNFPSRRGPGRIWPDGVLVLLLALLPCLFFWRLATPNPADRMHIAAGDFTEQYFPLRAFAAQEWASGRIPLWNPYLYGGQPALADIQSGALYPPHVLQALLLGRETGFPLAALEWQVILHFSLAAAGSYLFARLCFLHHLLSFAPPRSSAPRRKAILRRARFGAVVVSLVFTYGGYLTGFPVQQLTILQVSAWLPWVLWGLEAKKGNGESTPVEGPAEGRPPGLPSPISHLLSLISHLPSLIPLRAALAFALALLAGHPQTALYIFYLSLAYSLFGAISPLPSFSLASAFTWLRGVARRFAPWLGAVALAAMLAAAQLLPTLEFIRHSVRAELSYQAVSAGLPLTELVSVVYPGFFGGSPEYVGIAALVLVAVALALARPRPAVYFWSAAGLAGLLLAFGGRTFLYPLFYLFAPGFEAVRQQERAFLVYSFSAAMLSGYGAVTLAGPLLKQARQRYAVFQARLKTVAIVAVGMAAFYIYGSAASTARGNDVNLFFGVLRHHLFGLGILAGMLALLALRRTRGLQRVWGMGLLALWLAFNLFTVNWRFNLEKPDAPQFVSGGVVQFLHSVLDPHARPELPPARIVSGGFLPGGNSAASVYRLQDVTGNTPLHLAAVERFLQQMPAWRMWQLMNVHYVVDRRDISGEGLQPVFEAGELRVFRVTDPFPRVWTVGQVEVIPDDGRAIARLGADEFDLRRTAILSRPLDIPLTAPAGSTVTLTALTPTRLRVSVEASGAHLLVFSQVYYPGWQARLDGRPVELLRVNVIQQGVVTPPGAHTVELEFYPASFRWGGIISVVGLVIWGALLVYGQWGRKFTKERLSTGG